MSAPMESATSLNVAALAAELAPLIAEHLRATTSEPDPLIDAKAAGDLLGVPDSWMLAQARAGKVPHVKLGHYTRFDRRALVAWLDEQAQGPATGRGPVPPSLGARRGSKGGSNDR